MSQNPEDSLAERRKKTPFDRVMQKTAFTVLLLVLPIDFAFNHTGDPGRGRVAAICAAMIMLSVWMRWDLRNRVWFWATIVVLILHVPLIMLIRWTDQSYPGRRARARSSTRFSRDIWGHRSG